MRKGVALNLLAAVIILAGCDMPVQYVFVAENATDKDVTVTFSTAHVRKALTIPAHQSAVLAKTVEVTKGRADYFKDGLHVFDAIEVTQDGVPSRRRLHERAFWQLTWLKGDSAVYRVVIDASLF